MPPWVHIGLVFDYTFGYQRGVLRGIKQYAQAKPHWILVPHDAHGFTRRALRTMPSDAFIVSVVNKELVGVLQSVRRPLVNVASVLPDVPFPRVGVDHRQVGELAFRHLRDRGLHNLGFVGHAKHFYSTEREAGFRQALTPSHHTYRCFYEHPAKSYRQRGRLLALTARLQRWLRALPKPAGVFACHDVWGLQVVEACRLTGLRVPDDVAVIGVDNDDLLCELARPSLSSIIVPAEQIGYEAAAMLERLMRSGKHPLKPRLIPPAGVVTRQSSDILAGSDGDVTAAVRFIRDHAHVPLDVSEVLRAVPVSRRSLEQRFRATLERGVGEEIRRVHLERAKNLLATTNLSIAEVAQQAGFTSLHYLSRVFRQETGQTPTLYRRQFRVPVAASKV